MIKERPISYSPPMVRARNAGIKTQTRRALKNQPYEGWAPAHYVDLHAHDKHGELTNRVIGWGACNTDGDDGYLCPHGQPGQRLWVREAWRTEHQADALPPRDLTAAHRIWYEADAQQLGHDVWLGFGRYRTPISMPRWASRGLDEITTARVERLQDISHGDCMAEGCPLPNIAKETDPKQWYADLWEKANGPGSWAANPWVWVLQFKVLQN